MIVFSFWCGGLLAALLMTAVVTPQIRGEYRRAFGLMTAAVVLLWTGACLLLLR